MCTASRPAQAALLILALVLSIATLTACQTATNQVAPTLNPVIVPMFESTKPIAFRKVVLKVPRHQAIGAVSVGILCTVRSEFTLSGGRHQLDTDKFNDIFREELQAANYEVVGDPDALFEDPEIASAEYFIAGLISNVEANVCYPLAGFQDYNTSSAAVYMELEWQVYDTLRRRVVRKLNTKGSANVKERSNGLDVAFDEAFALAVRNLLADQRFYQLVRSTDEGHVSDEGHISHVGQSAGANWDNYRDDAVSSIIRDVVASPSDNAVTDNGRVDTMRLNSAVAVVRTAVGHGSGFVIGDGLLLTNQHVVSGARKVRLVFGDGKEVVGTVLAVDEIRDVALVQFTDSYSRSPLRIRTSNPRVGESV